NGAEAAGTTGLEEAVGQLGQDPDPRLATLMNLMHGQNHAEAAGTTGLEAERQQAQCGLPNGAVTTSANGQLDAVRAALRHVALMLGACPACCGEEASCPECHGNGKPGSVPSIA